MSDNEDYNWDDPGFDEYDDYGDGDPAAFDSGSDPEPESEFAFEYEPRPAQNARSQSAPVPADRDEVFERRTFDTSTFSGHTPVGNTAGEKPVRVEPQRIARTRGTGGTTASAAAMPLEHPIARPRRIPHSRRESPAAWWVTLRSLLIVGVSAVLISTLFSLWTRPDFFSDEFRAGLNEVQATQGVINIQPSPLPTETREIRIGIIAGHSGN